MNDLLERLDADAQPKKRVKGTWDATFIDTSSARLLRDWGPMLARLSIEGFRVHVLAPDDGGLIALEDQGCQVKAIPSLESNLPNPAAWLGALIILQGHLFEHPSALLHSRGLLASLLAAIASQRGEVLAHLATIEDHRWLTEQPCGAKQAPSLDRLGFMLGERARPLLSEPMHTAWRWMASQLDGYIVSNRKDLALLQNLDLIEPRKIEVIPGGQGVELDRFDPGSALIPSRADARAQLELPSSWRHVVGVAGVLEAPAEIASIARALAQKIPSAGWLVAEPAGGLTASARRAFEPLIRQERVKLVSPGLHMPRFYRALDVFFAPRYREGISTSILEAASMKIPSVAYLTHGSEAIIEDRDSGMLVSPGDQRACVDVLTELLDHPTQIMTLGERARTRARQTFGREASHEQVLRLFDRVLSRKLD
ncbi:MAG: glycosyltransferase [Myxococcota bacterium]|nr:glycosyltransferase [Myxococcota bacterium]